MSDTVSNCYVRRQLGGLSTEVLGSPATESLALHRDVITKFPTANVVEFYRAEFFSPGAEFVVSTADGGIASDGGTPQVETVTITAASGATSNGTLNLTVTGAGIPGSPLTVPVALTTAANTAAKVAALCAAAVAAVPAITALYDVLYGSAATFQLRSNRPRPNDATLKVAIPAALGITAAASSANTTPGVAGVWVANEAARWGTHGLGGFDLLHLEIFPTNVGLILPFLSSLTLLPGCGYYGPWPDIAVDFSAEEVLGPFDPTVVEFIIIGRDPHKH